MLCLILLCCKIDSDDTQTLINAKHQGGLWRVNETVQNIFIECEKIFPSLTSAFCLVFKCSELVQEMQANSIIISNYDSLCYSIEPKMNGELNLNLLKSMLQLFVEVRMFSFARDIKEKHKVKNKKTKVRSLRAEVKKSFTSKYFNHLISSNIQCSHRSRSLNIGKRNRLFL